MFRNLARLVAAMCALALFAGMAIAQEKGAQPSGSPSKSPPRNSKLVDQPDSGVRIVPLDDASDSDVKVQPQGLEFLLEPPDTNSE